MIDLYTYATPNGRKVSIMLEEAGLPYAVEVVDITQGQQHAAWFRALNPNGRIPVIVDHEGPDGAPYTLWESGAILVYLAEKTGRFLPGNDAERHQVMQWLMFQMGNVGPMFGQYHHFRHMAAEDVPYGKARYGAETERLYGVLDERLGESPWLGGPEYSIADMATYPWCAVHEKQGIDLAVYPNVARWLAAMNERPAVARGMAVPEA